MLDPADSPDLDQVYANYLKTRMLSGIEPVSQARALDLVRRAGLLQEWTEVLSGRPEPTTH